MRVPAVRHPAGPRSAPRQRARRVREGGRISSPRSPPPGAAGLGVPSAVPRPRSGGARPSRCCGHPLGYQRACEASGGNCQDDAKFPPGAQRRRSPPAAPAPAARRTTAPRRGRCVDAHPERVDQAADQPDVRRRPAPRRRRVHQDVALAGVAVEQRRVPGKQRDEAGGAGPLLGGASPIRKQATAALRLASLPLASATAKRVCGADDRAPTMRWSGGCPARRRTAGRAPGRLA